MSMRRMEGVVERAAWEGGSGRLVGARTPDLHRVKVAL